MGSIWSGVLLHLVTSVHTGTVLHDTYFSCSLVFFFCTSLSGSAGDSASCTHALWCYYCSALLDAFLFALARM